ncbi:MAG: O-antigen ligase family protein [Patescibacteria group bacterium]
MNFSWRNLFLFLPRVEKAGWYLFLFSLPIQQRVIVYQDTWYFQEWLSFAVYGTDILLVLLLGIGWLNNGKRFLRGAPTRGEYVLGGFFLATAASVLISTHQTVSMLALVRLCEFILLYGYIRRYALAHFDGMRSVAAFLGGVLLQAVIAITQFFLQRDAGLQWLGESVLAPALQGVASFYLASGEKIMRAYGTTPHPNVLAAYLLIALIMACLMFLRYPARKMTFAVVYGVLLWALVLTFSRTVIAVWALAMIVGGVALWKRGISRKALAMMGTITILYSVILGLAYKPAIESRMTISNQDEAVQLRVYYSGQALGSGEKLNLLGVGTGNFVGWLMERHPNLSRYLYQPVHNVYLLLYSEVGIVGLSLWLVFLVILSIQLRGIWHTTTGVGVAIMMGAVLAMGVLDHFPWTLQQGRFLLWGSLAVAAFCTSHRDALG